MYFFALLKRQDFVKFRFAIDRIHCFLGGDAILFVSTHPIPKAGARAGEVCFYKSEMLPLLFYVNSKIPH
jgi:hypothetical protein